MTEKKNGQANDTAELIKRLSLAVGITGYRGPNQIHELVAAELSPYVDQVERDRMGSVIGIKRGQVPEPEAPPVPGAAARFPLVVSRAVFAFSRSRRH